MGAEAPPGRRDIGHIARSRGSRRATLRGVKLGAAFWLNDTDWPSLREAIIAADDAGFDSLWFDDHLLADEGVPSAPKLEGWTVASAAAALTSRATIGHLVVANTFRTPGLLAKMAADCGSPTNSTRCFNRCRRTRGSRCWKRRARRPPLPR